MPVAITKNLQYYKFCLYGFFKNLRLFDVFLLLFFLENGLAFVAIGLLYSLKEIVLALTEIPSGLIADALGRRKTLISSFVFYIISFLVFFFADNFFFYASAMLLFAIGDAFRTGVHKAMIYHYLKVNGWSEQKVNYYGHTRSWSQYGSAISALAAAAIVFYAGSIRIIFLLSIFPYLLDLILVYSYPKYLDGEKISFGKTKIRQVFSEVLKGFFQSFKKYEFIKTLTSTSLYTGYYRAVKDYIQPLIKYFALSLPVLSYLNDQKKTALVIGLIYFISFSINAFVSRKAGVFAARFQFASKPMNITILLGFTVGIITGLAFSTELFIISIIGFIAVVAIENLRKPIGVALVADLTKEKAMATVLSASSQAKSIIAAILAPVIGFLADQFDPGIGIAATTLLLLLSIPLYWLKKT